MRTTEIAQRIHAHLTRFKADPVINAPRNGVKPYYLAGATAAGGWVQVCYVNYQGYRALRKADAERYLAWLDAGNVGSHYKAFSEVQP
mgnify:CR=1 FL=1